jgi:hypothetical protein
MEVMPVDGIKNNKKNSIFLLIGDWSTKYVIKSVLQNWSPKITVSDLRFL